MAVVETLQASDPFALGRAAEVIRAGGIVAVPTETFYGLAADATNAAAAARIFEIKGRPASMALPLVAASLAQVAARLGALDTRSEAAARAFWPGPLSLVLPAHASLATTESTVAIRVPAHAFVRALAEQAGTLLTSTSANRSGEPPAETATAVVASIGPLVDLVIDDGATPGGKPSTIADLRVEPARLVRDGAIEWSRVLESLK